MESPTDDQYLESDLVDLSLATLEELGTADTRTWVITMSRLFRQIEKPRANFSGGGAPGRAD